MMTLKEKLLDIRKQITTLEKSGRNTHQNYNFIEGANVQRILGNMLTERGIVFGRRNGTLIHVDQTTIVTCEYGLIDTESGEEMWYWSAGEGRDAGDKATYKAWTGAMKYFYIQAFSLGMGDDPEATTVDGKKTTKLKKSSSRNASGDDDGDSSMLTEQQFSILRELIRQTKSDEQAVITYATNNGFAAAYTKLLSKRNRMEVEAGKTYPDEPAPKAA